VANFNFPLVDHFGDKSLQAIKCTGTDNQTHKNQNKIHKKHNKNQTPTLRQTNRSQSKTERAKKREKRPEPKPTCLYSPVKLLKLQHYRLNCTVLSCVCKTRSQRTVLIIFSLVLHTQLFIGCACCL